jgi:ADP-ribose pyrophosphatase
MPENTSARQTAAANPDPMKDLKKKLNKTLKKKLKKIDGMKKANVRKSGEKASQPKVEKTNRAESKKNKTKKLAESFQPAGAETAEVTSSIVVYQGPLFRVTHDQLIEPSGKPNERDVIRHNGSVVILAVDNSKSKKNPWIVVERQYRHAANQYLWELPAGKLESGEDALAGAQRELSEETGYAAKKWKPLVEYFASPGFLGEAMKVFVAEGLVAGDAHPEADEEIEFRLVKLTELLKMIEKGAIKDGKTLTSVLLYARLMSEKRMVGKRKK